VTFFDDRVRSRRVDLVQRIRDGIPPIEYLPASEGMLVTGRRHHVAAPKKSGKSLGFVVHLVDMVIAGARVVVFDRENGANLCALRLDAILTARQLHDQADKVAAALAYYEFPRFNKDDEPDLVDLCTGADLIVFDSQRMYLSDLGLDENSSDDYTDFMAALIDPLFRAGIATLILDNSGHQEKRGRGSSSKGDLNEILFTLETIEKFNLATVGRIRLDITDSRIGTTGRWEMEIGGGVFNSWRRLDHEDADGPTGFRPTGQMERASRFIESCSEPPSRRTITDAIGGRAKYARLAIDVLVREGFVRSVKGLGSAQPVESVKPYREAEDPLIQAAESGECVPGASRSEQADRVPPASQPISLNHAGSNGASGCVPPASQGASTACVPLSGFPYGETPSASRPENASASDPEEPPDEPLEDDDDGPTMPEWEEALLRLQERDGIRMRTFEEVHAELERIQAELIDGGPGTDEAPPWDDDEAGSLADPDVSTFVSTIDDESEMA
jgi:hypothetical protein